MIEIPENPYPNHAPKFKIGDRVKAAHRSDVYRISRVALTPSGRTWAYLVYDNGLQVIGNEYELEKAD